MSRLSIILVAALIPFACIPARATVFASVHGVVHDPEHRPVAGATVTLKAAESEFTLTAKTNSEGEFDLPQAPIGVYNLTISATGFATTAQPLIIASGTNPIVHIPLTIESAEQTVVVRSSQFSVDASDSVTSTTLITREEIDQTPGATRTIGMEMITNYVPGAYMTHDMLHMRGGHQVN
jgi:Carboxypeptidase regulatory-like domain